MFHEIFKASNCVCIPEPLYLCLSWVFFSTGVKHFHIPKSCLVKKWQLKKMRSEKCQPQIKSYWVRMFHTPKKKIGKFSECPLNVRAHTNTKAFQSNVNPFLYLFKFYPEVQHTPFRRTRKQAISNFLLWLPFCSSLMFYWPLFLYEKWWCVCVRHSQ